ncbi:Alpha/beta hydrolase fold protein [Shewanella piezotolerans WP3]|uniref:Alpha/beta hydrolase fold protein n=1 Tax=Shewanella piezotolerans (strain WP3 / JCM 13877) TaxID=225849 RepID=B8CIU7_SHEPW|nr:Alpha/beta hydrolase fold protein [Shewanella piezotolerans WP3]
MIRQKFSPPWWARNPHIQTILPVLTKVDRPQLERERLELNDGDFIDLDWQGKPKLKQAIIIVVHGLEGSSSSHYARRILAACKEQQLCAVVHHHRSCSGELNRLVRGYHSGDTQDIQQTLIQLKQRYPESPLLAVGYSLGGNVLVKYQGELQEKSLLERAVAVSAPLHLAACAKRLEKGFSKVYQSYLIRQLQEKMLGKVSTPALQPLMPIGKAEIEQLTTFYAFDDKITAPLHGFKGVDHYYHRASGLPYLSQIQKPTLVIHAKDDPFMTHAVIPTQEQLAEQVEYELHDNGGHVGFIEGGSPWRPRYYIENRILSFLTSHIDKSGSH